MKAVDCVYLYGEERDTTGISSRCGAHSSSSSFSLSSSPYRSGSNKRQRTYPSLEDWAEQRIWYWFPWFPFLLSFPFSNKVWWKIGPILDALSALLVALLAIQDAQRSWNKERERDEAGHTPMQSIHPFLSKPIFSVKRLRNYCVIVRALLWCVGSGHIHRFL